MEEEETTVGKFYGGKVAELSLKGGFRFELVERELVAQVWSRDISQSTEIKTTEQHKNGLEETTQQALKAAWSKTMEDSA